MEIAVLGNGKYVNNVMKNVMQEYYSWAQYITPDGTISDTPIEMPEVVAYR